ncbi:hypothetical protein SUGI_0751470 [Cryptomeria japonica]|nr:hypothetical protein SUGI_0751470 [Cryptomeria japonica]
MERNVRVAPCNLGPTIMQKLILRLRNDVEGRCSGKYGYVVAVTRVKTIGDGLIRCGDVHVTFPVKFECIICRPFKNEIFEARVSRVIANGFFAEAGPLQFFVSVFCMPPRRFELERCDDGQFQFVDGHASEKIVPGTEVRISVMGIRFDVTEVSCVATMCGDFLGVIPADAGPFS